MKKMLEFLATTFIMILMGGLLAVMFLTAL